MMTTSVTKVFQLNLGRPANLTTIFGDTRGLVVMNVTEG
jgi:hypothetical protein